jgi:general secretion pathway protein B
MSLLMEALKQQQSGSTAPTAGAVGAMQGAAIGSTQGPAQGAMQNSGQSLGQSSGQGWKTLALVLLVLVGLLAGFLLASWLQRPANVVPVAVAPPQPASAGQILTELLTKPAADSAESQDSDEPQLLVSANKPVAKRNKGSQTLEQQVQAVESAVDDTSFAEQPAMAEADLDEPVAEVTPKVRELTSADVSDELRNKFALALEQSDPLPKHQSVTDHVAPARDIQTLDELLKRQIPPIRFEAHIYASDPKQRWVKVNGKDLQEGQWVTADIQLKEITSQHVLLQTGRQMFSMEALSEWSYRLPNP